MNMNRLISAYLSWRMGLIDRHKPLSAMDIHLTPMGEAFAGLMALNMTRRTIRMGL